ncbi:hypothetical protein J9303_08425 [Bacillaceae bacterium Marseille-Q3522]|nr:hypothetical protein [Bacillaceae bacterium Marseille-Q3522]
MEQHKNIQLDMQKLKELGLPDDLLEKIANTDMPTVNNHAEGGKGGHAISLTYVDNYSTLLLVYTFLLHYLEHDQHHQKSAILNQSLLKTLQTAMHEQKMHRQAFLDTVQMLNNKER